MPAPTAGEGPARAGKRQLTTALRAGDAVAVDRAGVEQALAVDGDGSLSAKRDAPLGGQAVLEGVMMRGVRNWAVAVRKPASEQPCDTERSVSQAPRGEIEVSTFALRSALQRHRALRLPVVRGVVALGGSLVIGFRALQVAANAQLAYDERDDVQGSQTESSQLADRDEGQISSGLWVGTIALSLALGIGLFFLVPLALTSLIRHELHFSLLFWLIEGALRTAIFFAYLLLLSRVHSLRRVFEYHGAEHKTISCFEAGLALTPANCRRFSRLHPRCGTSFLLVVMIVAIFVFALVGLPAWYWLAATRVLGVPLIAGISFELIKFAGRNRRRRWVRAVMWPGLQLQRLTTREPDAEQLEVAIAALEAVLARETPGSTSTAEMVGVEVVA